ncbi:MAG: porin, partial [Moraxellaceae bacterium]|nr:porin [Moraxellaceae bacterium]
APAFAQSNVRIYGSLDATVDTFTADNLASTHTDATHKTSRLGFIGEESLGGGLTAFFQLEERFQLDDATQTGGRWGDKSWLGLKGGFGSVSFGRVPTAFDVIYGAGKIGQNDTIADASTRRAEADTRYENGFFYTSPKLGPLTLNAATSLKETNASGKTPYGVSGNLTFGPAFVEFGYQKDGITTINQFKTWAINGGYKFSGFSLYAGFFRSKSYEQTVGANLNNTATPIDKHTRYALGADAKIGASGTLYATLSQGKRTFLGNRVDDPKYTKLGVAYFHDLSKRTQLFAAASYEKQDGSRVTVAPGAAAGTSSQVSGFKGDSNTLEDKSTGVQIGLRHAF